MPRYRFGPKQGIDLDGKRQESLKPAQTSCDISLREERFREFRLQKTRYYLPKNSQEVKFMGLIETVDAFPGIGPGDELNYGFMTLTMEREILLWTP